MKLEVIEALAQQLQSGPLSEIAHVEGRVRVVLRRKSGLAPGAANVARPEQTERVVKAPTFGLFRPAHPLRRVAEVAVGDQVGAHCILGFVEADSTLLAITAESAGTVSMVLCKEGELVGYGQPVFRLT